MKATPRAPSGPARWGVDRGLALLIGGVIALILIGLLAIPLLARQAPPLAAETTPEGVVQRFYQAVYADDWNAAHSFLSSRVRQKLSVAELQQQLGYSAEDSQVRTGEVSINDTSATVEVTKTSFYDGGLFDSGGEYSNQEQVLLLREGDAWKIDSGPFWLPDA